MYPEDRNSVTLNGKTYEAFDYCEIIHTETANVLANYNDDFYAGTPAITVNKYGKGAAYYVAFRSSEKFLDDFYDEIFDAACLTQKYIKYPNNVSVRTRESESATYFFVQNWNEYDVCIELNAGLTNIDTGTQMSGNIQLKKYETLILKLNKEN